jgi:adenylate cyclase
VAALLHAFCCLAVDVVEKHGGVVENVVGDSITAVWGAAPHSKTNTHAIEQTNPGNFAMPAVAAAQELLRVSRPLLVSSRPVAEDSPVQPLALGIGLESGLAIVGSYGPARRRAHAALGEPVSVANRIQKMTSDLSIPVLVGPQLAACLPAEALEPLGDYLLEGLGKHCALFAPTGWADLAPVDSNWAHSVANPADKAADTSDWSRWGDASKAGKTAALAVSGMGALAAPFRRTSA